MRCPKDRFSVWSPCTRSLSTFPLRLRQTTGYTLSPTFKTRYSKKTGFSLVSVIFVFSYMGTLDSEATHVKPSTSPTRNMQNMGLSRVPTMPIMLHGIKTFHFAFSFLWQRSQHQVFCRTSIGTVHKSHFILFFASIFR